MNSDPIEATPDREAVDPGIQLLSVIKEEAEPAFTYSICPSHIPEYKVPSKKEDKENIRPYQALGNEKKRKGNFEEDEKSKRRKMNPSS